MTVEYEWKKLFMSCLQTIVYWSRADCDEIEQRLSVLEAAVSSQKLAALSDQLTATATLVKDVGNQLSTFSGLSSGNNSPFLSYTLHV